MSLKASGPKPSRSRAVVARSRGRTSAAWGGAGFVAEAAARTALPARRLRVVLDAARRLSDAELGIVERLSRLAASDLAPERRQSLARGFARALELVARRSPADPLAGVDAPMGGTEEALALLAGEAELESRRRALLETSVGAAAASARIGRSRQALERLRRAGRVVALRVGSQWRYPPWQFEPDAPGGVVAGIGEVLHALGLSPAGAAVWLTQRSPHLGNRAPIEALRRGERAAVVGLATAHGAMP